MSSQFLHLQTLVLIFFDLGRVYSLSRFHLPNPRFQVASSDMDSDGKRKKIVRGAREDILCFEF